MRRLLEEATVNDDLVEVVVDRNAMTIGRIVCLSARKSDSWVGRKSFVEEVDVAFTIEKEWTRRETEGVATKSIPLSSTHRIPSYCVRL